jgi:transcriptional regulator with PAS, ATPase and Fis domain
MRSAGYAGRGRFASWFLDPFMPDVQSTAIELASLLDDSPAPVYVLDDDRRIVYCNAACARWLEMSAGELLGQRCVYHSAGQDALPASVAAGLCPPPKVFAGRPQTALVSCPRRDGKAVHRRGHFLPLSDGEDESAAVVAVLETSDCPSDAPDGGGDADQRLHDELREFRRRMAARFRLDTLLGGSPAMLRARAQVELAAQSRASVLVVGPRGSGKDHVARAIHHGGTASGSLVPLDCGVLEANLLRSTLRAAFLPGAAAKDAAATLLLSDVDCMPPEAQTDLAELLAMDPRRLRVVSTATQSLAELVAQERFRPGLACGLATITIELAPLGQRLEDLPLLAQAFLEEANRTAAKQIGGFSGEALDRLAAHSWPGNIDELAEAVRAAHERASSGEIAAKDLPDHIHWAAQAGAHPRRADETIDLEQFLAEVEKELISRAMRRAKNNKSKAARLLGLTRPRLYRRLIQLGLEKPEQP